MAVSNSNIRYRLVQQDDTVLLPDAMLTVFIADAQNQVAQIDDHSTELYTCYLISKRWQGLGRVVSQDGVQIKVPDPKDFLDDFNGYISKNRGYGKKFAKVSIDERYTYGSDNLNFENR